MGMPCEVNSILKLSAQNGYPAQLIPGATHEARKEGYRIIPIDVPVQLVGDDWMGRADVVISKLVWTEGWTQYSFRIHRVYATPFPAKEPSAAR